MSKAEEIARRLLGYADIEVNGPNPYDIQVHCPSFYTQSVNQGALGFGESYMQGNWSSEQLDETIYRILTTDIQRHLNLKSVPLLLHLAKYRLLNMQTKNKSKRVGKEHYDLGNDLYEVMLDPEMNYSCGYWKDANNLEDAQFNKLDLICKKAELEKGMKVLDIGCGWGSFARHAAKHYGAKVTGISISQEQINKAKALSKGYDVEFLFQDYRDVNEKFDRIISIGMFEHVGERNYNTYFKKVYNLLKDNGLFVLHTIGTHETLKAPNPWIEKYIFPNSILPSSRQIACAVEDYFVIEDWHNFGSDYDTTLMEWYKNFKENWDKIKADYDDTFFRMWEYYLLACAALFRAREAHLYQVVLSKGGKVGGYCSIR